MRYYKHTNNGINMKDCAQASKTDIVKLDEYRVMDGGIWIPKSELRRLMEWHDAKYTRLYNSLTGGRAFRERELQKTTTRYKICRDLVRLIEREGQ